MKNQLLNLKMIALMCLMMVLGGANVWAEQYKIVFAKGGSTATGSKIDETTSLKDVLSEGLDCVSEIKSFSNAFCKSSGGVKLGGKATGLIELGVADACQSNIKKITVKSSEYSSTDNAKLSLYNGTISLKSETPGTDLVYTFTNPTTVSSIKLSTSTSKVDKKSKPRAYISEIILETAESNNPTLVASETELDFGSVENNTSKDLTFKLSGTKLTADATLSVDREYFTVTPTSVAQTEGTITETDVTVSYNPTSVGSHTATLTISSTGAEAKTITLKGTSANAYTVAWNVNGNVYTDGTPTTKVVEGEKVTVLPTTPSDINGKVFVGWTSTAISGESASKPTDLFSTVENAPVVSANTTYYAVYANKVGTECWKKVTVANVNSEGEGEYALLTPDGHAFNGIIYNASSDEANPKWHGEATTDAFTFVNDKAENAPEGTCVLTLTKTGTNGYKMYNAKYGYLYAMKASAGNLAWHVTEDSYWSYSSSNWIYKKCNAYLRSYNNSFRTYDRSNGKELVFAKKVSDIAYSGYCTTVGAAAEPTYTPAKVNFVAHAGAEYYATFSNANVVFMPKDVTISVVTVDNNNVVMKKSTEGVLGTEKTVNIKGTDVAGYYIPANTGVLLNSKNSGEVTYYTVENKDVAPFDAKLNMLMPSVAGGEFTADADKVYYKLAYNDYTAQTGLGFYWGAENGGAFKVKAGTAYLAVPASEATAKGFTFNGEATGIDGVNANVENVKTIYNINGQRVASMAKPGLYIVNGKKVVRK